jgi:hypothetical protein
MDYLSLCLICKDENDYLTEWLDYHILVGVERFYIFDNESRVSIRESLRDYIEKGWVVVVDAPGKAVQLYAYDTCLRAFGKNSRWIGFIDTDEFLVPHIGLDLKELLKEYEDYGGLAVSSLFFGSNQQKTRPDAGQIASYTLRTAATFFENELIKCIVQPDKVAIPNSPHCFVYKPQNFCVNEAKQIVDSQFFPNYIQKIQLNHYFCRSLYEINLKLSRGRGDSGAPWKKQRFDVVNQNSTVLDRTILDVIQQIAGVEISSGSMLKTISSLARAKVPANRLADEQIGLMLREELTIFQQTSDKAAAAWDINDYEGVKKHYLDLINQYPQRVISYTVFALNSLKLNDPNSAWQALGMAWQLAPNSFLVLGGMAHYFLTTQNFAMAEKTSALALEIAPHNLACMGYMAGALIGQNRFEEAVKIVVPLVKLGSLAGELPQALIPYLVVGMSAYLEKKKDYLTLLDLWEAVVNSQPDNPDHKPKLARARKLANEKSSRVTGLKK